MKNKRDNTMAKLEAEPEPVPEPEAGREADKSCCCIVIPAYEPPGAFVPYVKELLSCQEGPVLVVDDGSGETFAPVFRALERLPGCRVLTHERNRGKGAALKTAIAWYNGHWGKEMSCNGIAACKGIVTADCDGQHSLEDVLRICRELTARPDTLILGCRRFDRENTPRRSVLGNRLISFGMRVFGRVRLEDTQTGLRGLPAAMLRELETLRGDRYEYELNMLLLAGKRGIPIHTIPIQTLYYNGNEASHYRTLTDSARILGQLIRGLTW